MGLNKTKIASICLASAFLCIPAASIAGADSGFYIGGGVGSAGVEEDGFDESDTAYKVFGGYNIGFIPLVDFAVEASYVDFGSPANSNLNVDISGINAFGLAGLSFGPFGIFAKAGAIKWDIDTNNSSDSGTDPAYGVGARFALGSFAVRAEYELYDLDGVDVNMVSVSGVYTF
jgi:hypothetical protein